MRTTTRVEEKRAERGRIVVGVDASEASKEALRWAARYARVCGASLDVIHAWHLADEHAWLQSLPPPANPTDVAAKALAAVVDEVVPPDSGVPKRSSVREGHAANVLVDAAKGAMLLVVGNRGYGGFDGLLLGSVSAQCAEHAPCTVVVVRDSEMDR